MYGVGFVVGKSGLKCLSSWQRSEKYCHQAFTSLICSSF